MSQIFTLASQPKYSSSRFFLGLSTPESSLLLDAIADLYFCLKIRSAINRDHRRSAKKMIYPSVRLFKFSTYFAMRSTEGLNSFCTKFGGKINFDLLLPSQTFFFFLPFFLVGLGVVFLCMSGLGWGTVKANINTMGSDLPHKKIGAESPNSQNSSRVCPIHPYGSNLLARHFQHKNRCKYRKTE